jgi:ribonuclease J
MVVVVIGLDQTGRVVAGPDIVSRGFVHLPEDDPLFEEARRLIVTVLDECSLEEKADWTLIKQRIRSVLRKFLQKTVDRRPMVLPITIEVKGPRAEGRPLTTDHGPSSIVDGRAEGASADG